MAFAGNQPTALQSGKMKCPCSTCRNSRNIKIEMIWNHLYMNGFMYGYKIWYLHGETQYECGSTSETILGETVGEGGNEVEYGLGAVTMMIKTPGLSLGTCCFTCSRVNSHQAI